MELFLIVFLFSSFYFFIMLIDTINSNSDK